MLDVVLTTPRRKNNRNQSQVKSKVIFPIIPTSFKIEQPNLSQGNEWQKKHKLIFQIVLLLHFSGMQFNFNKHSTRTIDSLGTPYDLRSMMHYGSTAFGGGRRTIETIDPKNQGLIGNRRGFSDIDIKQINLMYCSEFVVTLLFEILLYIIKLSLQAFDCRPCWNLQYY